MSRFAYYASPGGFRAAPGNLWTIATGLPAWGRMVVLLLALPGIVLIGLSLLALLTSIATLLLLTVPAYALLRRLADSLDAMRGAAPMSDWAQAPAAPSDPPRSTRRVEATVIE